LGRYLEGQGHSMTLQQNCVMPITSLFEVGFYNYFTKMITNIETTCHAQHLGSYLEGQVHCMTLQQNCVRPISSLFEVGFYNYFTIMITILRRRVVRNIWIATLKVKVTHDLEAKSCQAHNFVISSQI
jgi:hypothetical protein